MSSSGRYILRTLVGWRFWGWVTRVVRYMFYRLKDLSMKQNPWPTISAIKHRFAQQYRQEGVVGRAGASSVGLCALWGGQGPTSSEMTPNCPTITHKSEYIWENRSWWPLFMFSRNPNGAGLVNWPRYDAAEQYLEIGLKQKPAKKLKEQAVNFWTKILPEKIAESRRRTEL